MNKDKLRKDIHLTADVIEKLEQLAEKESRSLKNYMEKVLTKQSEKIKDGFQQPKN